MNRTSLAALVLLLPAALQAAEAGRSSGQTLLQVPSARAAALAETFTSARNDVSAFAYNPASLASLESGHTSFLYEDGAANESFGHVQLGRPVLSGGWGVGLGVFDGGELTRVDNGVARRVNAQQDFLLSYGQALRFKGGSAGAAVHFLSSEIAEAESGQAWAASAGVQLPLSRLTLGFAAQNFGTSLKYAREKNPLPRAIRAGVGVPVAFGRFMTTFLIDAPYYLNEDEFAPAAGVETLYGPLALRAGYKTQSDLESVTLGAGFSLSNVTIDYAFGLVDVLDSRHRLGAAWRFGAP